MLQSINIFITSLSLGLFCIGVNFYIDLHLGYEFLSIVIALEVASIIAAVAVRKNLKNLNIGAFSLVTLGFLIASSYLFFTTNFTSVFSHVLALMCIVIPVLMLSLFMIIGESNAALDSIAIKNIALTSFAGIIAGMVITHYIIGSEGLWGVFRLSAAALTVAIVLRVNISNIIKVSALCLFVGVILYMNNNPNMQLSSWTLFGKPVSKHSLNLLKNHEKQGWLIEKTIWRKGNRVDIVTSMPSRSDGKFWTVHNANIFVPYVQKNKASISWWDKHYPLMSLPFELIKPSKVLTLATVRGADADISQQYYGADTTSVYNNCLSLKGGIPCNNSALNVKLAAALNTEKHYDLVTFSNYNEIITTYAGASAQHEAIHTIEIFQKLYDSLNEGGLLAINLRNQTMMRKTLSYVWRVASNNDEDRVINLEDKIRVLALNKYNLKDDAYNYLVLFSKDGFTAGETQKINNFVASKPVSKIMYDTAGNDIPDRLTVTLAIQALTKLSSRDFKKFVSLEPSSIRKPDYFHLSKTLHPFVSVLSAIFLSLGLYSLIVSHGSIRSRDTAAQQRAPDVAKLLFQTLLCVVAFVLVLYALLQFITAALGYSSNYSSLLMISALATFAIPQVFMTSGWDFLRKRSGLWLYPVVLLLSAIVLITMSQEIITLLSSQMQVMFIVLVLLFSFCSGLLHCQTATFIGQLYSGADFWFWCMTSVATVLGVILAKYILINFDLTIMVEVAMILFAMMAFIAWWSLIALQEKVDYKKSQREVSA